VTGKRASIAVLAGLLPLAACTGDTAGNNTSNAVESYEGDAEALAAQADNNANAIAQDAIDNAMAAQNQIDPTDNGI
jgi:hypothetical protein